MLNALLTSFQRTERSNRTLRVKSAVSYEVSIDSVLVQGFFRIGHVSRHQISTVLPTFNDQVEELR